MRATGEAINNLVDRGNELSRSTRDELRELKIEVAKLRSVAAELREKSAPFQFAREREKNAEPELPSVLPVRRDLN